MDAMAAGNAEATHAAALATLGTEPGCPLSGSQCEHAWSWHPPNHGRERGHCKGNQTQDNRREEGLQHQHPLMGYVADGGGAFRRRACPEHQDQDERLHPRDRREEASLSSAPACEVGRAPTSVAVARKGVGIGGMGNGAQQAASTICCAAVATCEHHHPKPPEDAE